MTLHAAVKPQINKFTTSRGSNRTFYHRVYELPKNLTIVAAGLDTGQFLSDVATAEIIEAKQIESKDAAGNLVQVTAQVLDAWKD
jgi:hypothetical protein